MTIVALISAALAIALHVAIFWMESIAWNGPAARKTFGPATPEEVAATHSLAFNQGFYNLFLAVIGGIGVVTFLAGNRDVGATLIFAGIGAMLAAALVLFTFDPSKRGAAIKQGVFPLITVVTLLVSAL